MKGEPTDTDAATDECDPDIARWPLFGVGAAVSLCCLFAAPAATGAVVGGGAAAAAGGGLVRISVTALTVALLLAAVRWWSEPRDCECET